MKKIEVERFVFGRSVLPESWVFEGGDAAKNVPINFDIYLIRSGERLIAVDAGCVTMPGFVMQDFVGTVNALTANRVSPLDVTDVFITHSHHDHTECIGEFKNATFYIQSAEYEKCKCRFLPDSKIRCFEDEIEIMEGIRGIKIGGHSRGSSILEVEAECKTLVFAGDECYSSRCLSERILTGKSYSRENSYKFLKKYTDKKYHVYLAHD